MCDLQNLPLEHPEWHSALCREGPDVVSVYQSVVATYGSAPPLLKLWQELARSIESETGCREQVDRVSDVYAKLQASDGYVELQLGVRSTWATVRTELLNRIYMSHHELDVTDLYEMLMKLEVPAGLVTMVVDLKAAAPAPDVEGGLTGRDIAIIVLAVGLVLTIGVCAFRGFRKREKTQGVQIKPRSN